MKQLRNIQKDRRRLISGAAICAIAIAFLRTFVIDLNGQVAKLPNSAKISCRQASVSPDPLRTGRSGSLSFTISNDGTAPYTGLLKCEWVNVVTGRVDDLPQAIFNGVLNPGQFHTLFHRSNPIISPIGTYQMRVSDGNGKVLDRCTSQVFSVISPSRIPDLKVKAMDMPATVYPGEKLGTTVKVQNLGSWKSRRCKGRLYWDVNASFGEAARPLGAADTWPEIGPNESASLTLLKTLPIDLPNGPIYFFYCIDWDREVEEIEESNNCHSLLRYAAFPLSIVQPIGYVPYPNTPQGVSVSTDLNLVNEGAATFNGTLAVSLFSPQDSFLMDLAIWENMHIAPTKQTIFSTGIKRSPTLNLPIANNYKIYARYKFGQSNTFSIVPLVRCAGCLNPFRVNIVAQTLSGVPVRKIKVPSNGLRGQMRMGL